MSSGILDHWIWVLIQLSGLSFSISISVDSAFLSGGFILRQAPSKWKPAKAPGLHLMGFNTAVDIELLFPISSNESLRNVSHWPELCHVPFYQPMTVARGWDIMIGQFWVTCTSKTSVPPESHRHFKSRWHHWKKKAQILARKNKRSPL